MPNNVAINTIKLDSKALTKDASTNKVKYGDNVQADETDIASIDTRVSNETSTRTSKVTSVDARLLAEEATTTIQTLSPAASATGVTVSYDYATVPAIVGMMRSTSASDPIIACMLVGTPDTGSGTFAFSEALPSANYKLDIILST